LGAKARVGPEEFGPPVLASQFRYGLLTCAGITVDDYDGGMPVREIASASLTDARAAPGDDHYFAAEIHSLSPFAARTLFSSGGSRSEPQTLKGMSAPATSLVCRHCSLAFELMYVSYSLQSHGYDFEGLDGKAEAVAYGGESGLFPFQRVTAPRRFYIQVGC
jgi:hypothetical protein